MRAKGPGSHLYRPAMATAKSRPNRSLAMLAALADPIRFRAMHEIQQHGPTTTLPLANRMGLDVRKLSKHLHRLRDAGILEQGMGRVYKIPDPFVVSGERTLDFGPVVLRLGQD